MLAMAKKRQLRIQRIGQPVNVSSDSSICWREVVPCKTSLGLRDGLTSERGAMIEEGREIGILKGMNNAELVK